MSRINHFRSGIRSGLRLVAGAVAVLAGAGPACQVQVAIAIMIILPVAAAARAVGCCKQTRKTLTRKPASRRTGTSVLWPVRPRRLPAQAAASDWNYPTRSRDDANSSDDNLDTGPDHPDRDRGATPPRPGLLLTVRAQSVRSHAVTSSPFRDSAHMDAYAHVTVSPQAI